MGKRTSMIKWNIHGLLGIHGDINRQITVNKGKIMGTQPRIMDESWMMAIYPAAISTAVAINNQLLSHRFNES